MHVDIKVVTYLTLSTSAMILHCSQYQHQQQATNNSLLDSPIFCSSNNENVIVIDRGLDFISTPNFLATVMLGGAYLHW